MRILFNHGLTISEIFTNTPSTITDKKWSWFISRYGHTSSYGDAISDPFKYCFAYVLYKIINDKMRFKIPYAKNGFIDFEIVQGDMFMKQRQNGRFKDIDFIESDFTGYALKYYFDTKSYQKSYPIYLGGELRRLFYGKINSGTTFNSIKDFSVNDILDNVSEKFPELSKKEIRKILILGFRRLHSAMRYGCAISINTSKFLNCIAYIGNINTNPEAQIKDYVKRRDKKLRKIYLWKKVEFDGMYYVGMNEKAFLEWIELNKTSRNTVKFGKTSFRKIKEETYYRNSRVHIFKVNVNKFRGWSFMENSYTSKDVEYLGTSEEFKFCPSTKSWKEIIKTYETTSC